MTTEKTAAKEKQIKYVCYSCGVIVKAPEGFCMMCPKCNYQLLKTPTTKAEYEAVIAQAYKEISSLHAKIDQLEGYLNPADEDVIDVDFSTDSDIVFNQSVDYVDGTNTPVVSDDIPF